MKLTVNGAEHRTGVEDQWTLAEMLHREELDQRLAGLERILAPEMVGTA